MKALLPVLLLAFTSVANAEISVNKNDIKSSEVTLNITGTEASELKKIILDYEGSLDSILKAGIKDEHDASTIRSLNCGADACQMIVSAEALTNKDTQDYYDDNFNKKLLTLSNSQALVTPQMGRGLDGAKAKMDARFLRLLMEKSNDSKNIRVSRSMPSNLKNPDQISSPLYEVTLSTGNLSIKCYSSIVTGMGVVNFLEESCSVEARANLK